MNMLAAATIRVPASTSNLGGGFDTLGLAVRLYLTARYEPGAGPLELRREGTLATLDAPAERDLVRTAFLAELARRGVEQVGGTLTVTSEIPVGRGLGTSAAAVVGGLLLAAGAAGDVGPDADGVLDEAARVEGHADNAAPALLGGLVGVTPREAGGFRALHLPLSQDLAFAFAAPSAPVSTADARRVLPDAYPRRTAVAALGRLASLLYGLAHADGDALAEGLRDELHVPYRLPLIGGGAEVMEAARRAGAWGATVSGSGSGIIALCARTDAGAVAGAMGDAFRAAGQGGVVSFELEPEMQGARPVPPEGGEQVGAPNPFGG